MRCALLALVLFGVFAPVMAATPASFAEAESVLQARIASLTPPPTSTAARELGALTVAQAALQAYGGSADKADLKLLVTVAKAIQKALSPDPDVVAVLEVVRDHLHGLAQNAREDALGRMEFLVEAGNQLRTAAAVAKGDAAVAAALAAWPASPSKGAAGLAKAIAAYQKATAGADKAIDKEWSTAVIGYEGPYPVPAPVSFQYEGQGTTITAFPGQVVVLFAGRPPAAAARALLSGLGGTVLAQLPPVGCYLVAVTPGAEGAFIDQVGADPAVELAFPHPAGRFMGTGVTVLDDCGGDHGQAVQQVLTDRGVAVDACRSIANAVGSPSTLAATFELTDEVRLNRSQPTLINLSSGYGTPNDVPYDQLSADLQRGVLAGYTLDRISLLRAVALLPGSYRENLVITIAAGNDRIPLDSVLAELATDPRLMAVLEQNVIFVGSKGQAFSNYATILPGNFAWADNPEAANGTSFAAPYVLALIRKIMDQRGVSATEALRIVKQAVAANPAGELLEEDVLIPEPAQVYTGAVAGTTNDSLDGSIWRTDVALDLVVTVSGTGVSADPYQAQLAFDGSITQTLTHCAAEEGCDPGGTYLVSGEGDQASTGRLVVAARLGGSSDELVVRLTDGTFSADGTRLVAQVTVTSPAFDAPIARAVTLSLVP